MNWDTITNIILIAAIAVLGVFGLLGIYQWTTRKRFTKIDRNLRFAIIPTALMVITYFIFDHFLIWNTRPNGAGEPSFPSSHTMLVATVFALAAINLPKYIKSKPLLIILDCLMLILVALTAVGRVLANQHWVSDVVGAFIFSAIFIAIYYITLRKEPTHA